MYLEIKKELIKKGYFDTNGSLSKFVGTRIYEIWEEGGLFWIETVFDGGEAIKNALLDEIQALAPRYALTQAKVRSGKVRVDLTRPGEDAALEATRLDFLTQSLESAIVRLEPNPNQTAPRRSPDKVRMAPPIPTKVAASATVETDPEDDSYYDIRKEDAEPVRIKAKASRRPRPTASYVRPEENPNHAAAPDTVVTGLVDRSFSFLGFIAAAIGAGLGALIMAGVHIMGVPATPVAFLIPFLIVGIYRVMADHQMSISLAIFMVVGSLLLASVLISAIEVLQQTDLGILSALKQGIVSHYDNNRYYVSDVWIRFGMSLLAASIPTMLLLAGGKKKIQYSK